MEDLHRYLSDEGQLDGKIYIATCQTKVRPFFDGKIYIAIVLVVPLAIGMSHSLKEGQNEVAGNQNRTQLARYLPYRLSSRTGPDNTTQSFLDLDS
jgi:hypothetical protein